MKKLRKIRSPVIKSLLLSFALVFAFTGFAFASTTMDADTALSGSNGAFTAKSGSTYYLVVASASTTKFYNYYGDIKANGSATVYTSTDGITFSNSILIGSFNTLVSSVTFLKSNTNIYSDNTFTTVFFHSNYVPVDTTPPVDVSNVSATNVTDSGLTLNWSASVSSDVSSYQVFNGSVLLGSTSSTSYVVSGLAPSTAYDFTIKAVDGSNNVSSGVTVHYSTVAPVDTTPPVDVTNVAANNVTSSGLTLNWSASVSSDVSSYQVYKGLELLGSTALTSFDVSGLTPETAYDFTIKAVDGSNNVSPGATVHYSTVAAPVAPTNPDQGGDSSMTQSLFPSLVASGITTQAETWANNFDSLLLVVVGVGLGFAAVRFVKGLFF